MQKSAKQIFVCLFVWFGLVVLFAYLWDLRWTVLYYAEVSKTAFYLKGCVKRVFYIMLKSAKQGLLIRSAYRNCSEQYQNWQNRVLLVCLLKESVLYMTEISSTDFYIKACGQEQFSLKTRCSYGVLDDAEVRKSGFHSTVFIQRVFLALHEISHQSFLGSSAHRNCDTTFVSKSGYFCKVYVQKLENMELMTVSQGVCLSLLLLRSDFPSYICGVHHLWVRFLRMWPFFNPTIKVVTFRLRGRCVLGVYLLPAFTHLGHECQDLLSPCDEMHVCTD